MAHSEEWAIEYRKTLNSKISLEGRKLACSSVAFACALLFSAATLKGNRLHYLFSPYGQFCIFVSMGLFLWLILTVTVYVILILNRNDLDKFEATE
jgi:hypothetical protein